MEKLTILIASKHKSQIANEFEVSKQTVQMSLSYVFNSPLAKQIRLRAKELLIEEANKIKE